LKIKEPELFTQVQIFGGGQLTQLIVQTIENTGFLGTEISPSQVPLKFRV